jgi:hypothetical protein
MGFLEDVEALYEARPYPPVSWLSSLLQKIDRDSLVLLNYSAGYAACYGSLAGAKENPKILVAGCGTFEPVVVAMANPAAEIWAVDLSENSLRKLQQQLLWRGLAKRVKIWKGDFQKLPERDFDYCIATGVLHHLENPQAGLRALVDRSSEQPVFRLMLYSKWGRNLLYGAKRMAEILGIADPKQFRAWIAKLPADHPYRIYFHLYQDAETDAGLADGYLHPCDRPFYSREVRDLLAKFDLVAGKFLHRFEGQPDYANEIIGANLREDWDKIAALDALAQLEENFLFFAGKKGVSSSLAPNSNNWVWNPILPRSGAAYSRVLGKTLTFDQRKSWAEQESPGELQRALFLLPGGLRDV